MYKIYILNFFSGLNARELAIVALATLVVGGAVAAYSLNSTPEPNSNHRISYTTVVDVDPERGYVHPFSAQVVEKWNPDTECCLKSADTVEITLVKGHSRGHLEVPILGGVTQV